MRPHEDQQSITLRFADALLFQGNQHTALVCTWTGQHCLAAMSTSMLGTIDLKAK
jgi:hypothetical protein